MSENEPKESQPVEQQNQEKDDNIVCAWCGKGMGKKKGIEGISHSICPKCEKENFPDEEEEKHE